MTEKPQVDFEEVVKASGMPVTEEEIRDRFNAIATEEGIITNTSRMSPFWRLVTAIVTAPVMWLKRFWSPPYWPICLWPRPVEACYGCWHGR